MAQECFSGHGFVISELAAQSCGALEPWERCEIHQDLLSSGCHHPEEDGGSLGGDEEQLLIPTGGRALSFPVPWVICRHLFRAEGSSSFVGNDLGREEQVGICSPHCQNLSRQMHQCSTHQESQKRGGFVIIGMINIPRLFHPKFHFP